MLHNTLSFIHKFPHTLSQSFSQHPFSQYPFTSHFFHHTLSHYTFPKPFHLPLFQHRSRHHHRGWSRRRLSRRVHDVLRHLCLSRPHPRRHCHSVRVYHHRISITSLLRPIHHEHTVCCVFCDGGGTGFCVDCHWAVWLHGTLWWCQKKSLSI